MFVLLKILGKPSHTFGKPAGFLEVMIDLAVSQSSKNSGKAR